MGQGIPPTLFSYDAVWAEYWTNNLPNAGRMRYQLCHRRGLPEYIEVLMVVDSSLVVPSVPPVETVGPVQKMWDLHLFHDHWTLSPYFKFLKKDYE